MRTVRTAFAEFLRQNPNLPKQPRSTIRRDQIAPRTPTRQDVPVAPAPAEPQSSTPPVTPTMMDRAVVPARQPKPRTFGESLQPYQSPRERAIERMKQTPIAKSPELEMRMSLQNRQDVPSARTAPTPQEQAPMMQIPAFNPETMLSQVQDARARFNQIANPTIDTPQGPMQVPGSFTGTLFKQLEPRIMPRFDQAENALRNMQQMPTPQPISTEPYSIQPSPSARAFFPMRQFPQFDFGDQALLSRLFARR